MFGLPIDEIISDIRARLCAGNSLVLEAPPGAGKTTVVPLILKDEPWLQGHKIVMLEPRRLAARAAARRMASLLNESVGETVGYTMRLDRKVGPKTRIEVVTEACSFAACNVTRRCRIRAWSSSTNFMSGVWTPILVSL